MKFSFISRREPEITHGHFIEEVLLMANLTALGETKL
jgi:hypothetical protein